MIVDCDRCAVRGAACAGCVVSALLDQPQPTGGLDQEDVRVVELFEWAGFEVTVLAEPVAELGLPPVRAAGRSQPDNRRRGRRHAA